MLIPPEAWLLVIGFATFFLGFLMGFGAGQSNGKAAALEEIYGMKPPEEEQEG
jgi:hypothetical protein